MSRLKRLLHVATPSTCNTQQTPVQRCRDVAQHVHTAQQAGLDEAIEERAANDSALTDLSAEARRQKVLAMLEAHPETQRAILADIEADADNVILTIALRNAATCEMLIPKAKYDPWKILELLGRYGQTTH